MVRHVVRTDRASELCVSKNAHDPEKIHLSLVGVHFFKTVQPAPDITHVDLVDFSALAEILNNRQNFTSWVLQSFCRSPQTQLKPVVRAVDDGFIPLDGLEN